MRPGPRTGPRRRAATGLLIPVVCWLFLTSGCGVSSGPQAEGPVPSVTGPTPSPSVGASETPTPVPTSGSVDAPRGSGTPTASGSQAGPFTDVHALDLRLVLLGDPHVDPLTKTELERCGSCDLLQPEYADLTGRGGDQDVVVSVKEAPQYATSDAGGDDGLLGADLVATYAYRLVDGSTLQIFAFTGADYTVAVSDHEIVVIQPVYGAMDPRCCPSGMRVVRNKWDGSRLVPVSSTVSTGAPDPER